MTSSCKFADVAERQLCRSQIRAALALTDGAAHGDLAACHLPRSCCYFMIAEEFGLSHQTSIIGRHANLSAGFVFPQSQTTVRSGPVRMRRSHLPMKASEQTIHVFYSRFRPLSYKYYF